MAGRVEVSAQPSVATKPSRASMPTAMRPGKTLQASNTSGGFLAAALPRITRRMPASSQAAIPARSRIPPPSCTGIVTLLRMDRTATALTGFPAKAPFRSTTCSQAKPASCHSSRLCAGVFGIDRRLVHFAAAQANAASVFQIDGRIEGQISHEPRHRHGCCRPGYHRRCRFSADAGAYRRSSQQSTCRAPERIPDAGPSGRSHAIHTS